MAKRGRPPKVKTEESLVDVVDEESIDVVNEPTKEPVDESAGKDPAFDLAALGMRQVDGVAYESVLVDRPGFGPVREMKSLPVKRPELQCDLTVKEAKALVENCGEQVWAFNEGNDHWQCIAVDGATKRRFMVTNDVYAQLQPETKETDG